MGEGRKIRGIGRSLGQTSQGVDLIGPSILDFLGVYGVRIDEGSWSKKL